MDSLNPILRWDRGTLIALHRQSLTDANHYETASKATHVFLIFFGLTSLTTFGMTKPSYTATTSTLIILAYGPACEVSVESWKVLASNARKEAAKFQDILEAYGQNHCEVQGLENRPGLKAQWYALKPTPIEPYQPPSSIDTFEQGEEALNQRLNHQFARMENAKKKIYRAYILHVAENPLDTRRLGVFGEFNEWRTEHMVMGVPFAFFKKITLEEVETEDPQTLKRRIFTT